jgi:hypothetical protein
VIVTIFQHGVFRQPENLMVNYLSLVSSVVLDVLRLGPQPEMDESDAERYRHDPAHPRVNFTRFECSLHLHSFRV